MTPQEFAEECLRILRYREVNLFEDLEDGEAGDLRRVHLTEAWCRERAAQIGVVFAGAFAPEERTPVGYALAIERPSPDEDDDRIT